MLRRRTEVSENEPPVEAARPGAKGRPTPKRREAEHNRRRRAAAPRDRKEAVRLSKERQRELRARTRTALATGDERYLPNRDRGPVRRFARDFVDARRSAGELFFPVMLLVLVLTWFRNPTVAQIGSFLFLFIIVLVVTDSITLALRLRSQLRKRFPNESQKGVTTYALLRSSQIRRWRLPKPQVKPGTRL